MKGYLLALAADGQIDLRQPSAALVSALKCFGADAGGAITEIGLTVAAQGIGHALDAASTILRAEGVPGLLRKLWPNRGGAR